jgi:hypothetical protein
MQSGVLAYRPTGRHGMTAQEIRYTWLGQGVIVLFALGAFGLYVM